MSWNVDADVRPPRRPHPDPRLRGEAAMAAFAKELAAGVVLRSGGRSAFGGKAEKTFARSEL